MEDLPELPPHVAVVVRPGILHPTGYMRGETGNAPLYAADQMREYARKAVLAERERILAKLRDWHFEITEPEHVDSFAAAIRGGAANGEHGRTER